MSYGQHNEIKVWDTTENKWATGAMGMIGFIEIDAAINDTPVIVQAKALRVGGGMLDKRTLKKPLVCLLYGPSSMETTDWSMDAQNQADARANDLEHVSRTRHILSDFHEWLKVCLAPTCGLR
ncbi:hypothetical protein D9756_007191 [Leucocoprinus leucothites]|uniref:Uncharacterized protein n=1 Tax=Leucocoprinus leucothites TaxID=201217 RepID=A0A8H5D656_9AGAR|nr:hypothetical protein D9756_007191 [Leucoagaricus leucothites]